MNHACRITRVNSDETFRYSKSFTLTYVDDSRVYFRAETNVSIVRDTISVFPIRI